MITGKKILKFTIRTVLIIVAIYTLFYILMIVSCSKVKKYEDATDIKEAIRKVSGAYTHIPDTEELGTFESIKLYHKETKYALWKIESLTLMVKYDATEFENALNQINLKYAFLEGSRENLFEHRANIKGYTIQIVEKMQADEFYNYPKCFLMIGTNAEDRSIIYMYHYDSELDCIKDLEDFIDKYYTFK